jgi:hypothetical protein
VTNDFNLNKVAQLRGVQVLNINELANSLKPVVLPGEVMRVFVLKEGKEAGQGVGYLDDGTMVVVDQAKKALGKTIEVTVTSVLQTTAGKMIFCRWSDSVVLEENGRREARPIPDRRSEDRRDPRNGREYRGPERRTDERWPAPAAGVTVPATSAPSLETRAAESGPSAVPASDASERGAPKAG